MTSGAYSLIHSFGVAGSGDGANPVDAMVVGLNGNLYGTLESMIDRMSPVQGAVSPLSRHGKVRSRCRPTANRR
jgi:hypothetical protein